MLKKEFVPHEQSLALKELGFDEPCFGYWNKDPQLKNPTFNMVKPFEHEWCLPAPLFSQAFRWFREKYFYISYVCAPYKEHNEFYFRIRHIGDVLNEGQLESCESQVYKTYEKSELACLEKLIEIIEFKSE